MRFAHNRGFSCIARAMRLHRTGSACKLHNVRKKKSHFITIHLSFIPFLPFPIHSLGRIVGTAKAFSLIYVLLFGLFKSFSFCAVAAQSHSVMVAFCCIRTQLAFFIRFRLDALSHCTWIDVHRERQSTRRGNRPHA